MRSKLPAESGFSRCKDAIKSPCQPSATLPPWGGVVYEGLAAALIALAFPATALGRGDPGHTRGSARRTARARLGYCARTLQPRRPPLEGLRPGRVACAKGVRLELLAGGRSRGGGSPGPRVEGSAPACAAGGSVRSSGRGKRGASIVRARSGQPGARALRGAPRNRSAGRSRWWAAPRSSPGRPGAPTNGSAVTAPDSQER